MAARAKKGEKLNIVRMRVDQVIMIILENDRFLESKQEMNLINIIMEKFNVCKRQAQRYAKYAKEEITQISQKSKEEAFERAVRDREYLYRKAISPSFILDKNEKDAEGKYVLVADLKLALDVAKDRDRLFGLYEDNVNISGNINTRITFVEDLNE